MSRLRVAIWIVGVALVAAACAGPPPPTDPPQDPANSNLDQVVEVLRAVSPGTEGSVWSDTTGNLLAGEPSQWLLQTPRCWGSSDCTDRPGSAELLRQLTETIATAERTVDITTLWPFADGGFRDAIIDGLRGAISRGNLPTVRILAGTPFLFSFTGEGPDSFRAGLVAELGPEGAALPVAVATSTTALRSWNHSKIVAVDRRRAIVGGHNMWSASYLESNPVSDLSMRVEGPAAAAAVRFIDILWGDVCTRLAGDAPLLYVRYSASAGIGACPRTVASVDGGPDPGSTRVLAVGRLGLGVEAPGLGASSGGADWWSIICPGFDDDPAYDRRNPGAVAARALVRSADDSVFISQQDLLSTCPRYDPRMFAAITDRLIAGVRVTIVVTGAFGTSYANMESLYDLSEQLYEVLVASIGDPVEARDVICSNLQLASLRIGPDPSWPDGAGFANHAKFIHVDDRAFTIGSNNMYPASLQELDFMVEDPAAAAAVRSTYLEPLWEWSRATAVIDPEQGRCQIEPPVSG